MFASPDALDREKNLVGFDEVDEEFHAEDSVDLKITDKANVKGFGVTDRFARPVGWSDYQSAWLDAIDNGENGDEYGHHDHGERRNELSTKSSASVATNTMDIDDGNEVLKEERQALLKGKKEQQKEHQEFPDEVQVNEDEKARDRFCRYRSLKSFKNPYCDPKENLPDSYASIYHFRASRAHNDPSRVK